MSDRMKGKHLKRREFQVKNRITRILTVLMLIASLTGCGGQPKGNQVSDGEDKTANQSESAPESGTFKIGETWTVDGQWSLTVNSVEKTDNRNPYSDKSPAAVYIVNYTYTNLGYTDSLGLMNGLFFGMDSMIVDSAGMMGYSYPGEITKYPTEVPVNATCEAQSCIGVDNEGSFSLTEIKYDGDDNKQQAVFEINIE